jgi:hypothetical protein
MQSGHFVMGTAPYLGHEGQEAELEGSSEIIMQEKNKYKYTYTVKDEFMRVHNNLTCRIK